MVGCKLPNRGAKVHLPATCAALGIAPHDRPEHSTRLRLGCVELLGAWRCGGHCSIAALLRSKLLERRLIGLPARRPRQAFGQVYYVLRHVHATELLQKEVANRLQVDGVALGHFEKGDQLDRLVRRGHGEARLDGHRAVAQRVALESRLDLLGLDAHSTHLDLPIKPTRDQQLPTLPSPDVASAVEPAV
eukprot:5903881-Prymnesium_polylepis.2